VLYVRLVVAAVGLLLLALLVALPEPVFSVVVTCLIAAAAIELFVAVAGFQPRWLPLSVGVASALIVLWTRHVGDDFPVWTLLPLPALALYGLLRPGPGPRRLMEAWWLGVVVYLGVLGAYWALLRSEPDGRSWIIVLLGVTFATDTGAYAIGSLFGHRPMFPRISPKKTWEGAAGGYIAGVATSVVLAKILTVDIDVIAIVVIAVTLPIAAQVGDFLESALKRRIGIKDTSHMLPGHGGLLDRMDSQLIAGPLLYWLVQWV
jgi:phosphatidate cytidylyltransferase